MIHYSSNVCHHAIISFDFGLVKSLRHNFKTKITYNTNADITWLPRYKPVCLFVAQIVLQGREVHPYLHLLELVKLEVLNTIGDHVKVIWLEKFKTAMCWINLLSFSVENVNRVWNVKMKTSPKTVLAGTDSRLSQKDTCERMTVMIQGRYVWITK